MSVLWFVKSGPDASHIFDVAAFDMLRDAKAFAESLPVTPTGLKRPYEIWRHEYFDHKRFGNTVNARMVTPNYSVRGDMPHRFKPVRRNQEYQKMRSKWLAYHPT